MRIDSLTVATQYMNMVNVNMTILELHAVQVHIVTPNYFNTKYKYSGQMVSWGYGMLFCLSVCMTAL